MTSKISRSSYADMYGPTTRDKIRLADTALFIEVEHDLTTYGEEVKFGGGKVIRDGMGQSQVSRKNGAVDTVITNALIYYIILYIVYFQTPADLSWHLNSSSVRVMTPMTLILIFFSISTFAKNK